MEGNGHRWQVEQKNLEAKADAVPGIGFFTTRRSWTSSSRSSDSSSALPPSSTSSSSFALSSSPSALLSRKSKLDMASSSLVVLSESRGWLEKTVNIQVRYTKLIFRLDIFHTRKIYVWCVFAYSQLWQIYFTCLNNIASQICRVWLINSLSSRAWTDLDA